jgi:hypothetical protein
MANGEFSAILPQLGAAWGGGAVFECGEISINQIHISQGCIDLSVIIFLQYL